jgi:hypothetical protein
MNVHDYTLICGCSRPMAGHAVHQWEDRETASKAKTLLSAIADSDFFFIAIHVLSHIFAVTLPLSKALQSEGINMVQAISYMRRPLVSLFKTSASPWRKNSQQSLLKLSPLQIKLESQLKCQTDKSPAESAEHVRQQSERILQT